MTETRRARPEPPPCDSATAADLDQLAQRQPDQEARAREAAKRHGSALFVAMLDAEPDDESALLNRPAPARFWVTTTLGLSWPGFWEAAREQKADDR